jgi:RimJ/RimL family protein N-acetyltransferase
VETAGFTVRRAAPADFDAWFEVFQAVAAEGRWIGRELPLDREEQRRRFVDGLHSPEGPAVALVAESEGRQVGHLFLRTYVGIGEIGMAVDAGWRRRGVGSALLGAAVAWARDQGLHKLTLQCWSHNAAARHLYQKSGFVEEGRMRRHYRRGNGELWDAVVMGLVLDETSPGSSIAEE